MSHSLSDAGGSDDVVASDRLYTEDETLLLLPSEIGTEPSGTSSSVNFQASESRSHTPRPEPRKLCDASSTGNINAQNAALLLNTGLQRIIDENYHSDDVFDAELISPSARALSIIKSRRRASVPAKITHSPKFLSLPLLSATADDCSEDWTSIHSAEEPTFKNIESLNPSSKSDNETPMPVPCTAGDLTAMKPATVKPADVKPAKDLPQAPNISQRVHPEAFSNHIRSQLLGPPEPVIDANQKFYRIVNFFLVPGQLERTIILGYTICIDSLLGILAVVPVRLIAGFLSILLYPISFFSEKLKPARYNQDFVIFGLMLCAMSVLFKLDMSTTYHDIREQSMIKLYVFFNVLDIFDRLCSSFGADILDSLFERVVRKSPVQAFRLPLPAHFLLSAFYLVVHAGVYHYQSVTLNVTINTSNNALLALLISTQFIEIKSTVFKRFEFESLFQVTCADVVERVNLSVFLLLNVLMNFFELIQSEKDFLDVILPIPDIAGDILGLSVKELELQIPGWIPLLWNLATPALIVCISEFVVDWIKHCFVGKFNNQHPDVYRIYRFTLAQDVVDEGGVPRAARRVGLNSLPLALLFIRVSWEILSFSVPNLQNVQAATDWALKTLQKANFSFDSPEGIHETVQIFVKITCAILFLLVVKFTLGFLLSKFCANSVRSGIPATHSSVKLPQTLEAVERYTLVKSRVP